MILALIVTVVIFIVFAVFANQMLAAMGIGPRAQVATPTPKPTPTPTPTPSPTPTQPPSPTPSPTPTNPLDSVMANAYYVMDMDSGNVLVEKNSTTQLAMGSTTKIMTAIITLQHRNPDNDTVVVHQDAVDRVNSLGPDVASTAQLKVDDILTVSELLYGLLVPSGADAAVALADDVGGNVDTFVQMMNNEAQALGLTQTHFTTPDGLTDDTGHYTTAADLTHLANYAMTQYPLFAQIVDTPQYDVSPALKHSGYHWQTWNNLLLNQSYPGIMGVKTGYTAAAGACFVFAAQQNGHRIIGTLLGSPNKDQRDRDAKILMDWGFAHM